MILKILRHFCLMGMGLGLAVAQAQVSLPSKSTPASPPPIPSQLDTSASDNKSQVVNPKNADVAAPVENARGVSSLANKADLSAQASDMRQGSSMGAIVKAQVLLDRARFSPGEIDGVQGQNLTKAIAGYQKSRGLPVTGVLEAKTWQLLNSDTQPILIDYALVASDVQGPFEKIPEDMMEKSKLPKLNYESPLEGLAEKFHASPKLIKLLNPGKTFSTIGEQVVVPNVARPTPAQQAATVVVDRSSLTLSVLNASGQLIAQYPATVGSERDPLPIGQWQITGVFKNPNFYYNPNLFWDADPSHSKAKIQPGPNNPVGVVWIDLSKEHYGIHGTPEPRMISKSQSHGCIRLTNWDIADLSEMVQKGTAAILQE